MCSWVVNVVAGKSSWVKAVAMARSSVDAAGCGMEGSLAAGWLKA
ncbi:MAG: hypothetical protein AB7U92_22610 [Piscinibacter sp.]